MTELLGMEKIVYSPVIHIAGWEPVTAKPFRREEMNGG